VNGYDDIGLYTHADRQDHSYGISLTAYSTIAAMAAFIGIKHDWNIFFFINVYDVTGTHRCACERSCRVAGRGTFFKND
jgi:hypothetical protein